MTGPGALGRLLARRRGAARLAILWERLWPRLWPPIAVAGLFLIVAFLDLPQRLPAVLHAVLLLLFLAAFGLLAWRSFRGFAWPGRAAAERRLEQASGLAHRPLATLADRPTGEDPATLAVWRAHQARAAAQIRTLRVGAPRPGLARRDPRAFRAALGLGLIATLVMAGAEAPERLRRALVPSLAGTAPAPALRLEAWVTPPGYTGAAPVFLEAAGGAATVPQGSRLQVAVSGGAGGVPELLQAEGATPFRALDGAGSFAAEAPLAEGGQIAVQRDGQEIVRWAIAVQADAPPRVRFTEPPARAPRGLAVRLPWEVADDWGAVALRAELRLAARPEAPPLVLDLPLPARATREARGTAQPDLSAHPWAGLDVEARLVVRDGAEQEGTSDLAALLLPERSFNHPVAQRLIAVRKGLSLAPEERAGARGALDEIARAPEAFEHDTATYLALRSARSRLAFDPREAAVEEVQALLWEVALALEEGRDGRTLRALQQAREALREALDRAERNDQAMDQAEREEVQRRIQELREAIRQHLEALAEKLQRENAEAIPFDPQSRMMDQREMDRRTRRMEEAAREGRTEDARRELAELEEMLRALEEGRMAQGQDRQRQQQRRRGEQQMGVVQDMVRRQGQMLDRSHQRAEADDERAAEQRRQEQRNRSFRWPPQPGQPPNQGQRAPGQQQAQPDRAETQEREQDARRQRALRRALGELMQQFGDLTGEVPEGLGRADQAMRDAQEALGEGRDAGDAQSRAMRALMEGGQQMAQAMQRQFGMSQDGEGQGEPQESAGDNQPGGEGRDRAQAQGEGRDPLGRNTRDVQGQADNGSDTRVPEEAEILRTRRLQDELRRRAGELERPPEELDYLDRLLRRF